jgi:hypothetical protein
MGGDMDMDADMEPVDDDLGGDVDTDMENDDFAASEPATGGEEPADRAKRESIQRIVKKVTRENVDRNKLFTQLSKKK